MDSYSWAPRNEFVNRIDDLAQMEAWWGNGTRDALAMVGRRRVGKSWLFRRFADGKPAVILVADRLLLSTQMARFAKDLEPMFGVRPAIPSLAELIRLLYELGREEKVLAIIDEFPFLLPDGQARDEALTEVQAVMEQHRDLSQTKLVLCGSLVSQMESLLAAKSPLHGRLQKLDVWPLTFAESRTMTDPADSPEQRITRFAMAGGMARYLAALGHEPLRDAACKTALNYRSQMFDDPRAVLEQELRDPATYFSILEALADGPAGTERLTRMLQRKSAQLTFYLETLRDMRLVHSERPVGAPGNARSYRHEVSDGFIRFWFKFVFPNQDGLQQGLSPYDVWDGDIEPYLNDFVAPTFEELCARYTRQTYGARAQHIGGWWGPALNKHRQARTRLTEEIDVVGAHRHNLVLVGECKWTNQTMPTQVLNDLRDYKIPAVAQEDRLKVPADGPDILLFSRSGFSTEIHTIAAQDQKLKLVTLDELVAALDTPHP